MTSFGAVLICVGLLAIALAAFAGWRLRTSSVDHPSKLYQDAILLAALGAGVIGVGLFFLTIDMDFPLIAQLLIIAVILVLIFLFKVRTRRGW